MYLADRNNRFDEQVDVAQIRYYLLVTASRKKKRGGGGTGVHYLGDRNNLGIKEYPYCTFKLCTTRSAVNIHKLFSISDSWVYGLIRVCDVCICNKVTLFSCRSVSTWSM